VAGQSVLHVDGRAKPVSMTARGWALYGLAGRLILGLEAKWAARIGVPKLRELKRLLGELWATIESEEVGQEARA
jgi:hypothetical protein